MAVLWSFMAKYRFDWIFIVFSRGHRSKFIWSCSIWKAITCYYGNILLQIWNLNITGYFRNPTGPSSGTLGSNGSSGSGQNANGSIYGFTLRRKMAGSPAMTSTRPRPSFRQYNATVTSRQSHISVDSLASPLSSLTLISQTKAQNSNANNGNNIDSAMTTLSRNRGPRPAYSDANMQHSLGYLPWEKKTSVKGFVIYLEFYMLRKILSEIYLSNFVNKSCPSKAELKKR